jgi:hypothetical protein
MPDARENMAGHRARFQIAAFAQGLQALRGEAKGTMNLDRE